MPSYEIFERRDRLQMNNQNRAINSDYAAFYPKAANGKPRFLEIGEPITRSLLERLPPYSRRRFDDCIRACKTARARANAVSSVEGKPELWPNLERPRKKRCG